MIPLGDLDVQDVKKHLKIQKRSVSETVEEDIEFHETTDNQSNSNPGAEGAEGAEIANVQLQLGIAEMNRRREEREERLGMR